MSSLVDMEICLGIEARTGHGTSPCDQGGNSPLDSSSNLFIAQKTQSMEE
jgi:hypothetical protein